MPVTPPNHRFKVWPEYFEPIKAGRCLFYACLDSSLRFRLGDVIEFEEWHDRSSKLTGATCKRSVTYALVGGGGGAAPPISTIARGYSVVSLSPEEVA